jgi:hypothetical protein
MTRGTAALTRRRSEPCSQMKVALCTFGLGLITKASSRSFAASETEVKKKECATETRKERTFGIFLF